MKPEEFDEILRRSAETEREIPFDETAWQSLAGHLNAVQPLPPVAPEKPRRGLAVLPWLLFLPLLGWNFWLQTGISDLKKLLLEQNRNPSKIETLVLRDTVFETRYQTIVRRDTVWIGGRTTAANPIFSKNGRGELATSPEKWAENLAGNKPFFQKTTSATSEQPATGNAVFSKIEIPESLPTLPPSLVQSKFHRFLEKPENGLFPQTIKKNRPRPNLTAMVWAGGSSVLGNLEKGWQGLETGLQLGIGRRSGWSGTLGLARRRGWFLPSDGSLHGVLPPGNPANPTDELHHANAVFDWFSLAPGLQFSRPSGSRSDFFVAAGFEADFLRKANYDYEFESALDPGTEYHLKFSGEANGLEISRLWLKTGLQWDLKNGYFWQVSLNGRAAFRRSTFFPEQGFLPGLQIGVGRIW